MCILGVKPIDFPHYGAQRYEQFISLNKNDAAGLGEFGSVHNRNYDILGAQLKVNSQDCKQSTGAFTVSSVSWSSPNSANILDYLWCS